MWVLTVGIDKYFLTPEEKAFYMQAKENGAEVVQLRDSLIVSTKFVSLVEESEGNPITSDRHFLEYLGLKNKGDDISVRRKMVLEKVLDSKYPYERFTDEWEEAQSTARGIIKA